jgi:predicted membrane channel-forming protein YqfA (hemolysin III family)
MSTSQVSAPIEKGESYVDALKKHLPAGLLATYLAADGILAVVPQESAQAGMSWAVFALCLVACPFWMIFYEKNKNALQIVFACVSFVILVFATGGPLALTLDNPDTIATVQAGAAVFAMLFTGLLAPLLFRAIGPGS